MSTVRHPTAIRRQRRRLPSGHPAAAAALALALTTAACGAADRPAEEAAAAEEATTVVVTMTDGNRFSPGTATIAAGGTVVWRNTSSVVHTVTGDGFDSGDIAPGETYRRTFRSRGKHAYWCIPHRQAGMVGTVVVK